MRIDGPDAMAEVVRRVGLIPFFRNPVPGWSIEDMTAPGCWFDTDGVLGPWDWKIDVVRSGIAYGKFLGGRAAFATEQWYRELMNYRRSLPKYAVAQGDLAKPVYDAILEAGSLESKQVRRILSEHCGSAVKKNVSDTVLTFLQMGTWCLVGDFERVYRGPNLVYSGWQLSSNTTPEQFWSDGALSPTDHADRPAEEVTPSWAWRFEEEEDAAPVISNLGSPEESRQRIIDHVLGMSPDADIKVLEKMI